MSKKDNLSIVAFITLVLGVGLLGFVLYLIPFVFMGFHYDVPDFLIHISAYFELHHKLHPDLFYVIFLLPFVVAGIALLFITYKITQYLDEPTIADAHSIRDETVAFYAREEKRSEERQVLLNRHKILTKVLVAVAIVLISLIIIEIIITEIEFGGIF